LPLGTNVLQPFPGTNVFAVELHESSVASDFDIYFGVSLDLAPVFSRTSPLPPQLKVVPLYKTNSPTSIVVTTNVVSWPTNVGGFNWGLQSAATLLKTNTVWTTVNTTSPYTNTISNRRFFRAVKTP
jgi:hypothetical protein